VAIRYEVIIDQVLKKAGGMLPNQGISYLSRYCTKSWSNLHH